MSEIEKAKMRREERAVERARRDDEMALLARERARAEFHDWEKKEHEFDFDQSRARSEIRLREGRPKPIDFLVRLAKKEACIRALKPTESDLEEVIDPEKDGAILGSEHKAASYRKMALKSIHMEI